MKPILLGPQEQIAAAQFRSFYARLIEWRDTILAIAEAGDAAPARQPSVEEVRASLRQAIADFGYQPDDRTNAPLDPGYVMAAIADEVLLIQCLDWSGHAEWTDRPLESMLYDTSLAGDRIFDAAQELRAQRRDAPRTSTTILLALLAGFRGRYYARDDHGVITEVEKGLYRLVCKRDYSADDPSPYATPNLTATTLTGQSTRPLPVLWPWIVALTLVVLAYLPISHLIWWSDASKIDAVAERIVSKHEAREETRAGDRP